MTDMASKVLLEKNRFSYLLVNYKTNKVLARIMATPSTIDMLNAPDWMTLKNWKYVPEAQSRFSFDINV